MKPVPKKPFYCPACGLIVNRANGLNGGTDRRSRRSYCSKAQRMVGLKPISAHGK